MRGILRQLVKVTSFYKTWFKMQNYSYNLEDWQSLYLNKHQNQLVMCGLLENSGSPNSRLKTMMVLFRIWGLVYIHGLGLGSNRLGAFYGLDP